ncbi:hypothetical protein SRABI128_04737 [Microbacterium sp. Bi128]|nr:hypothetical protein SRABI128_04737 [Microbacterium sp. Bi128]
MHGIGAGHVRGGRGGKPLHHGLEIPDEREIVELAQIQAEPRPGKRRRGGGRLVQAQVLEPYPGLPKQFGDLAGAVVQPRHAVSLRRDEFGEVLGRKAVDLPFGDVVQRGHGLQRQAELEVGSRFLELPFGPFRVRGREAAGAFEGKFRVEELDGGTGSRDGVGGGQLGVAVVGPRRVGQQVFDCQFVQFMFLVSGDLVPELQPALHAEPVADNVAEVAVAQRNEVPVRAVDHDLAGLFHVGDDTGAVHPGEPGQGQGPGAGEDVDDLPGLGCFPGIPGPDDILQRRAAIQHNLIEQCPHGSGQDQVSAFDLFGDDGLQERGAAADQLVQLACQGGRDPMAQS